MWRTSKGLGPLTAEHVAGLSVGLRSPFSFRCAWVFGRPPDCWGAVLGSSSSLSSGLSVCRPFLTHRRLLSFPREQFALYKLFFSPFILWAFYQPCGINSVVVSSSRSHYSDLVLSGSETSDWKEMFKAVFPTSLLCSSWPGTVTTLPICVSSAPSTVLGTQQALGKCWEEIESEKAISFMQQVFFSWFPYIL